MKSVCTRQESPVVPVAPGILTDSETVICERNVQDIVLSQFAGRLRELFPVIFWSKLRESLVAVRSCSS